MVIPSHSDSGTSSLYQFFNFGSSKLPRSKTGRFTTSVDPLVSEIWSGNQCPMKWPTNTLKHLSAIITFADILRRNSQSHIQQLHDIAHSIKDRVASQPFPGRQHLLMGDLDFTNMAIDNNIDHLQFRKVSGSCERIANSVSTELKPHALERQEAVDRDPHTWRLKRLPGRAIHHCLVLPRVCLSSAQFQTLCSCACQSNTESLRSSHPCYSKSPWLSQYPSHQTHSMRPNGHRNQKGAELLMFIIANEIKVIPLSCRDGAVISPPFLESFSAPLGSASSPSELSLPELSSFYQK